MGMDDPHVKLREAALTSVLRGPALADASLRQAAHDNMGLPNDLQYLVGKIHAHAYRVTNEDVATAQKVYGDDRLFEIIVSAATGASTQRLTAALDALEDA
jgi:hypothetical protein